ncbi:MmgE/PrpD family protein [Amycolatopsis viridis]|uniref:2-methylcitrate dehydratase PrpD n=1 Tax=Amycolatopsis viridis TaxID=185678 RepID=A0ABX0SUX0_9PSEU|nr:MmgE/PrpD family protein [Amycolatopsis viridis]NIH80761.1 2-methylcitrate dehydratase PrpD [Amycolatopsis viridis]
MSQSLVERLAEFSSRSGFAALPDDVVEECKRILLDSLGCALAAVAEPGARKAVEFASLLGGASGDATLIGASGKVSIFGAAFANADLVNALDMDAVVPPGHVTPYVVPGALAVAEAGHKPGKDLIAALAVAHEMSYRIGKATDYLRDIKDGEVTIPPVYGYSSTVFGATAAVAMVQGLSEETLGHALGIAASIAPVNAMRAWMMHTPSTTIKYMLAGTLPQTALTAAHLAEFGHRGDLRILDDAEFGWPRFIGTTRWEPERITAGLGSDWKFVTEQAYKPYPHCRILHAPLDALREIVETHDLAPEEIDSIKTWGEPFVQQPVWLNRTIAEPRDAEFSIAHGLAVGAHRVPPGRDWLDPELVHSRSVLELMEKVSYEPHADYVSAISGHPAARPSRVEVTARGQTFVGERSYPKGVPSPDPATRMTTEDLVAKFRHNAGGVLPESNVAAVVDAVLGLEAVADVSTLMDCVRPPR